MEDNLLTQILSRLFQDRNLSGHSEKWANWMSKLTLFTCQYCVNQHGKIVDISVLENQYNVMAHPNCECIYVAMRTKSAGSATKLRYNGADAFLFYLKRLPDYYVDKKTAYRAGWQKNHKQLDKILPGKMLGGDHYYNDDQKLPSSPGRVWYEADINYNGGNRNRQRILYSNDGLIFVTYDHYQTFFEITQ